MEERRPRILLITHRVPYPPDKGDRIRSYQLLRFLAQRGEVHLATLADEPVGAETRTELERLTTRLAIAKLGKIGRRLKGLCSLLTGGTLTESMFRSPSLQAQVHGWLRDTSYDLAVLFSSATAQYLPQHLPVLCDLCDVDSEKWLEYGRRSWFPLSWLFRTEGKRLRRLEARLGMACEAVTLVTRPELELFRSLCPTANAQVIPVAVDLHRLQPAYCGERNRVVFVGTLDYRPNVEGIRWFCERVWPQVRLRLSRATLFIVGRNPVRSVRRLAKLPGIEVIGPVPDVRPYVRRAAVSIAPLHVARGVQNKVLEALAMGKAVLASPGAAEGLDVRSGNDLLIAPMTPDAWRTALCELLCDDDLRQRLGRSGRHYVETHHNEAICLGALGRLLDGILAPAVSSVPVPVPVPVPDASAFGIGDGNGDGNGYGYGYGG